MLDIQWNTSLIVTESDSVRKSRSDKHVLLSFLLLHTADEIAVFRFPLQRKTDNHTLFAAGNAGVRHFTYGR